MKHLVLWIAVGVLAVGMGAPNVLAEESETEETKAEAHWASTLLGDALVKTGSDKVETSSLEGKKVGIYFSAHWCPPCRFFTPKLVEFYNKTTESHDDFEVVFVSSDKDLAAMTKYHHKMPWLAMPYNREEAQTVGKKYGVRGIPTFIVFDEKGEVVDATARAAVTADPDGAYDKWFGAASAE